MNVASVAKLGSLAWLAPVLCFPIMVGLSLDYVSTFLSKPVLMRNQDVFLLTRIAEFRRKGFSDHASIINGVAATGPVWLDASYLRSRVL